MTTPRAIAKRYPQTKRRIIGTAIALGAMLLTVRAYLLGYGWSSLRPSFRVWSDLLAAGHHDLLYVTVLTLGFLGLLRSARYRPLGVQVIGVLYAALALVTVLWALANVKLITLLGRPLNYPWLYYSDFLMSLDARQAILSSVSWQSVGIAALLVMVLAVLASCVSRGLSLVPCPAAATRIVVTGALLVGPAYFVWSAQHLEESHWDHVRLENPVVSFVTSLVGSGTPELFTMDTPVEPNDVRIVAERDQRPEHPAFGADSVRIRNVLVYVLESVSAEYVLGSRIQYPVTPELERRRGQSRIFTSIYAHAPSTNKALISILTSTYPWISY